MKLLSKKSAPKKNLFAAINKHELKEVKGGKIIVAIDDVPT